MPKVDQMNDQNKIGFHLALGGTHVVYIIVYGYRIIVCEMYTYSHTHLLAADEYNTVWKYVILNMSEMVINVSVVPRKA